MRDTEEWQRLWRKARWAMAPFERAPHPHLIDRLVEKPRKRGWLEHCFGQVADVTRNEPPDWVQEDDVAGWFRTLPHPATLTKERVRILLKLRTGEVLAAYPDRFGTIPTTR
jgi:hypothetical protein